MQYLPVETTVMLRVIYYIYIYKNTLSFFSTMKSCKAHDSTNTFATNNQYPGNPNSNIYNQEWQTLLSDSSKQLTCSTYYTKELIKRSQTALINVLKRPPPFSNPLVTKRLNSKCCVYTIQ